jgi:lipoate-protein ligase A
MQDPAPQIEDYTDDDDLIAETRQDRMPRLRIYCPESLVVVLGRGSKPEKELHLDNCRVDSVSILRRRGGGCAVVLDPGNVIVSLAVPFKGLGDNKRHLRRLSQWLIRGLAKAGIDHVEWNGISDLAIKDRKIGGSCLYRTKDLLYYSSTLLVDPDLDKVERYLAHPPREPGYRQGRSHLDFMDSLARRGYQGNSAKLAVALRGVLLPGSALTALLKGKTRSLCL